jgi:hypothetical protein
MHGGEAMNCGAPLDAGLLADYWIGALGQDEEAVMEEHLFACEDCAAQLAEIIELAGGVHDLAHSGALLMVVSGDFLKQAEKKGLRVRQYAPPAGGSVQCTVTAEDDLLVGRLAANLNAAKQVDLSICDLQGIEQLRLRDIPFAPDGDGVIWQQSITFAKAAPTSSVVARLLDVDATGGEKLIGEYTFHHTRTLPGPGAW